MKGVTDLRKKSGLSAPNPEDYVFVIAPDSLCGMVRAVGFPGGHPEDWWRAGDP